MVGEVIYRIYRIRVFDTESSVVHNIDAGIGFLEVAAVHSH